MARASLAEFARPLHDAVAPTAPLTGGQIRTELLCGLTVALALVPEAVAFAFVAGVHPLVGLYAAFFVGLITSAFGGRPGMISGATGAMAVVMVALVAEHGVEYLFAAVVLTGLIQIAAGLFKLGRFIRLVPNPVMLGFVNGLAIVIFIAQLAQFQVPGAGGGGVGGHGGVGGGAWLTGTRLYAMLALTALTMVVIWGMPKVTKLVPAPLAAIAVTAGIVMIFNVDVPRVGDMASISGGFPAFHIPAVPMTWETLRIVLPYAALLAAVGLIESLLTLNLVGEITGQRGGASRECVAQGAANTVTGFFGGMGGCAMIGQSMINVNSGGRTRLSGIAAAVFLLLFILVAAPLIELIPLAALVGVMFMVVIGTFAWRSFRIMTKVPRTDAAVIVLVTVVTVFTDLATAVIVGVIVSALAYAWENAVRIRAERVSYEGVKVYRIEGPLFFGSAQGFGELFTPEADPELVVVDFAKSRVADQSALEAIDALAHRYEALGKRVELKHLSDDCVRLLDRADQLVVRSEDDPDYGVAAQYGVRAGAFGAGH
ncbi:SulP family inorganic anion transporter [Pseudoroseicyclus sp. CXY001]|uniref:SulP family inorganic anion transporter n=1 Tax=Pseudoroseicyclus sp. CXY001 TaxID=3242492 RepID=UPI003570AB48